jgi:hypothetical protein
MVSLQDMKDEYDFSAGERGRFHRPDATLMPPMHLELVTKQDLAAAIEMQTLRLTVRLGSLFGGLLALGIAALAALIKLT